jgi:hypothetical protein
MESFDEVHIKSNSRHIWEQSYFAVTSLED